MNHLQINLTRSILKNVDFCNEVEQFLTLQNIANPQRFKIVTCILEAVGNLLQHASTGVDSAILMIHCQPDRVVVDLLDSTTLNSVPQAPSQLQIDKESGRGLWILEHWMDQVRFQPTAAGTHLRLSSLRA